MKFFVLTLLLVGCASPQCKPTLTTDEKPEIFADQVNRDQLLGAWVGEEPVKDGSQVRWFTDRRRDGTYSVKFKITGAKGEVREQTETGLWGIAGGIYFTLTRAMVDHGRLRPVNTQDASYYDAYKALRVSPSEFSYQSLSTREEFTVKRVGPDFKL